MEAGPALSAGMLSIGAAGALGRTSDRVQVRDRRLQRLVMRRQGQCRSAANDTTNGSNDQAFGSAAHVRSNLFFRTWRRDNLELPVSEGVIGLLWTGMTRMRIGSAGRQRSAGKKRQKLATRWMRQAGYDLPRISISGRSNYTAR
jgi:hypothetical protein